MIDDLVENPLLPDLSRGSLDGALTSAAVAEVKMTVGEEGVAYG